VASAIMAIRPPSPLLSARRISSTYLNETTRVMVQNSSESTPRMLSRVTCRCALWNTSRSAYSGLVPMSPNTTPSAVTVSAARAAGERPFLLLLSTR
jgi:hypothetical protein